MELHSFGRVFPSLVFPLKLPCLLPFSWKNKRQRSRVEIRNRNEIRKSNNNNINNRRYKTEKLLAWKLRQCRLALPNDAFPHQKEPLLFRSERSFSAPSNYVRWYRILGYWLCPLPLICAQTRTGTKPKILLSSRLGRYLNRY